MKYYVIIGHKMGEKKEKREEVYDFDEIEIVERNDEYLDDENGYHSTLSGEGDKGRKGAHQFFGHMDVNFNESAQYSYRATKTQEGWLIGRHRISRSLDFGSFGYQFVRKLEHDRDKNDIKRIQFPDKFTLSFDKRIKDNNVNNPPNDDKRVDIELTDPQEQLIHCYDKECTIDPIVFKLASFDNYGDAYIDLQDESKYKDFELHIGHFVHFMKSYPNSSIYLNCQPHSKELKIKELLKNYIKEQHVTNYFEFCDPNFERRSPTHGKKSGTPYSEYDTFSETIDEFFNESTYKTNSESERDFYQVPFKKAKITVNKNWNVHAGSENFQKFLQNNPDITLEIAGDVAVDDLVEFIKSHSIKAKILLSNDPYNKVIEAAIAHNRLEDMKKISHEHGYDKVLINKEEEQKRNEEYRATLEKYVPQKLNLARGDLQNVDVQVGQNQNQNQNQNQAQQIQQSHNELYEPIKLEINSKSSIPDVDFRLEKDLLKSVIGFSFQEDNNAPQTESHINYFLKIIEKVIENSPASKNCYCPLSYSVEELIPGAFYIPKERLKIFLKERPRSKDSSKLEEKDTLFFSPPYASIAIKKDKYAFKPLHRPVDTNEAPPQELISEITKDQYIKDLTEAYVGNSLQKVNQLINQLYVKRGQPGVDLLMRSLYSLKLKNPVIHFNLIKYYLLTSKDFSEYVDSKRFTATFETLGKLKDPKKIMWWNKLLEIQCRNNPNFDLNHLFSQFISFWEDMDKLQKFIPIPEQFPFNDFADAGITLGKMYRIMGQARNRYEQINSFREGNISHAYMLFDLFQSTMYCKEMNECCIELTKNLTAEDAFDKSQLKGTYFSTASLAKLTEDSEMSLGGLKSYLLVFAAVNGNTQKHNNSDLAFYKALMHTIDQYLQEGDYTEEDKKLIYSTILLFASYGNNTTIGRMDQDIKTFFGQKDLLKTCKTLMTIYSKQQVSAFFSAQENSGKMAHSEAMPSFHTVVTLCEKKPDDYRKIMKRSLGLITNNKTLSPAVQKIMREMPDRMLAFEQPYDYLQDTNDETQSSLQSLFLMNVTLNSKRQGAPSNHELQDFYRAHGDLDKDRVNDLNRLFLDINVAEWPDFSDMPSEQSLFSGNAWSYHFQQKISEASSLDSLIFVLHEYDIPLRTITASEEALIRQIKDLEPQLESKEENKQMYARAYGELVLKRLNKKLGAQSAELIKNFKQQITKKINDSFSPDVLRASYKALDFLVETESKDLIKLLALLKDFSLGATKEHIAPDSLLNGTALLLKHIDSKESVMTFLETIQKNAPQQINAKLLYLQSIFQRIAQESSSYEDNDTKKKLTKEIRTQLKKGMELVQTLDTVDPSLLEKTLDTGGITTSQYLQFLEVLASPPHSNNPEVKKEFTTINERLLALLQAYPDSFAQVFAIAQLDPQLLMKLTFNTRDELKVVAGICHNERHINARKAEQPAKGYQDKFAQNIKVLLDKKLNLEPFYSDKQLASPSAEVLVQLLNHFGNQVDKALHHYEKDPWFSRPHKKKDLYGTEPVENKELAYQMGQFDMSKQNEALDKITSNFPGFEKSVRRNLLFTLSTYINELGYRLPAFHTKSGKNPVPVRKLSNEELHAELGQVRNEITNLRHRGKDNIWQNKKYQRALCKLLAIVREAMYREGEKNAYSTQMDAILLALLAGDYQYAMQINTGEGKLLIATFLSVVLQITSGKQIVVTSSNLSLAGRDSGISERLIRWCDITHETISATTKEKLKLNAEIIHTTASDFALCHGKDVLINNGNRIYLNDEYDYTLSHLTPAINSQSKPNEEENWWKYEEVMDYLNKMDEPEAKKRPEQQVGQLIRKLITKFTKEIEELQVEQQHKLVEIDQNKAGLLPEQILIEKETLQKEYQGRIDFYQKRIAKLNHEEAPEQFNILIDSAIIAQFVLKKGVGYEVIDQVEDGKTFKKVVPTEHGKPITEGDVLYMYGIHQFLIEKTLREFRVDKDLSEFLKPTELESTTYFNNYSIQAGSKSINITGTVPAKKYKMYEALMSSGRSDIIPPHKPGQRKDVVPESDFNQIKVGNDHVCKTEEDLIKKLAQAIQEHDGPALLYCSNKNSCEERSRLLIKALEGQGYTVQVVIPGVTEDFTDGDKITTTGMQATQQKTVTLTVGDGRGIDVSPKGKNGLLTVMTFVPDEPETVLQVYGRSGRNGQPGSTNLFILENELNKYGIKFSNLAEEFKFLDEIRHKEFDFAIKKIGFMQYEVQKEVGNEHKTVLINYMDDLYNQLILKAVAEKVKNKKDNRIGDHTISGRWEPFAMLNEQELEGIYQTFCESISNKLQTMGLNLDIDKINQLQPQYQEQVKTAVKREEEKEKGLDPKSIREKIQKNAEKQDDQLKHSNAPTVELADGMEIDLTNTAIREVYNQMALNLGRYDKTLMLMQKYVGSHVGIYGFITDKVFTPYDKIYQFLERQKQEVKAYQHSETETFYEYLVHKELLGAMRAFGEDTQYNSTNQQEVVEQYLEKAMRYNFMLKSPVQLGSNTLASLREKCTNYYENKGKMSKGDVDIINNLKSSLSNQVQELEGKMANNRETVINQCQTLCQQLQETIYTQGTEPLKTLTEIPLKDNNSQLAHLFSMLDMSTKNERNSAPVKKIIKEISEKVSPTVNEFNEEVKRFKQIIKQQRVCYEYLKRSHNTRDTINKYEPMVNFDNIASKNLVSFYHQFHKAPETLLLLKQDIIKEQAHLDELEVEVEKVKLEEERRRNSQADNEKGTAELNKRNQHINKVQEKITSTLNNLRSRINEINHPLREAITVANTLLGDLEEAQTTYINKLKSVLLEDLPLSVTDFNNAPIVNKVNSDYIDACEKLINNPDTRRVLERDLGWGPYLNNLLKTIANILILGVTFGKVNNFFPLEKSETIRVIDEETNNLKPGAI